jgi:hypothetical protein
MKYIGVTALLLLVLAAIQVHSKQAETPVYSFRVSGKVIYETPPTRAGATVYIFGTRPINGRIPWAHAKEDGTFSIEFTQAADNYRACAHQGESGGLLPLTEKRENTRKITALTCSREFVLNKDQREQQVEISLN